MNTGSDTTMLKNYRHTFEFVIKEYELVKAKQHPKYRYVQELYTAHKTCAQNFLKYYNRYKLAEADCKDAALLPAKRGPKYKSRRTEASIEDRVIEERKKGLNRYEIHMALKPILLDKTPSPSCIYHISRRHNMNRLTVTEKLIKQKIIKERAGELLHVDCHYLPKHTVTGDSTRYYMICVIDDCSRIAWAEVTKDIKALTVMFVVLRCFNQLHSRFNIKAEEVLTDNGAEFGARNSSSKQSHPFERMLIELGVKHRYTKPYRPQTNGKVERMWRTIKEDLIEGTSFDSYDHLADELFQYLVYYNKMRPHQALGGMTPEQFLTSVASTKETAC